MREQPWRGETLGGAAIAVSLRTGEPRLMAASHGAATCFIESSRLGDFLRRHGELTLVCENAGLLHREIAGMLSRQQDQDGLRRLWAFSAEGRLHDLSLLDWLVRTAEGSWERRPLAESNSGLEPATLLGTYQNLIDRARSVIARMGVGPELTGRYGPLGLASRVEARIAAATLTARGVRLHAEARARLLLACERQRTRLLRRLAGNRLSKAIFKYSGGEPRLNRRGYPEVNEKRFNTWAVSILDDLTDLHGVPLGLVGVGSELIRHRDDLPDLDLGHPWLNCWLTCGVLAP